MRVDHAYQETRECGELSGLGRSLMATVTGHPRHIWRGRLRRRSYLCVGREPMQYLPSTEERILDEVRAIRKAVAP